MTAINTQLTPEAAAVSVVVVAIIADVAVVVPVVMMIVPALSDQQQQTGASNDGQVLWPGAPGGHRSDDQTPATPVFSLESGCL